MHSESIIRYYVNVASDSLFWHKQYEGGQKRTETFCPKFKLRNGRVPRLLNEKQKLKYMGKEVRPILKAKSMTEETIGSGGVMLVKDRKN